MVGIQNMFALKPLAVMKLLEVLQMVDKIYTVYLSLNPWNIGKVLDLFLLLKPPLLATKKKNIFSEEKDANFMWVVFYEKKLLLIIFLVQNVVIKYTLFIVITSDLTLHTGIGIVGY